MHVKFEIIGKATKTTGEQKFDYVESALIKT
jgi:hypothetical protein